MLQTDVTHCSYVTEQLLHHDAVHDGVTLRCYLHYMSLPSFTNNSCPTKRIFYRSQVYHLRTHPSYTAQLHTHQFSSILHQNCDLHRIGPGIHIRTHVHFPVSRLIA